MSLDPSQAWPAPAKLNLMLRIVGRRADGYHLLQTVFQFIDVADRLRFQVRADGEIKRISELSGVDENHDLVVRAARLLQQETDSKWGADIELEKKLPMGGGLGGGSSDAATTLVALNQLWETGLETDHLAHLGLSLGADVPVFVRGYAAWAEGVGEHLEPISLSEPWFLVVVPPCHVSTAEIFTDPELTRDSPRITIRDFLAGEVRNDCLGVVLRLYPEVAQAMEWLGRYAEPRLTGTGACVFAEFEDEAAARRALQQLPQCYQGLVGRGLNRSPLLDAAAG